MKRTYRYRNMFMYGSLQFCGHIEEYFSRHTEKLVVFIVMPRLKNRFHILRRYGKGRLIEEKKTWSSDQPLFYYLSWYVHYIYYVFFYYSPSEKFIVLSSHPISFFGMSIQKLFRRIIFAYWIGDYFPPTRGFLYLFEKLKSFYHARVTFHYYLSDRINRQMNQKILRDSTHRTVMWGVKPIQMKRKLPIHTLSLLFVGLIKEGQGLERLFAFLRIHSEYSLNIIGICDDVLFVKYQQIIKEYKIGKQVFFPNMFYSDEDLQKLARTCHVGIALYDVSPLNATYYTDPGKIKSYAEMNLPIIMSNTSGIAPYIKRFQAGEVIGRKPRDIEKAIKKTITEYPKYIDGLKKFNVYFYYELYYNRAFKELENI